MILLKTRLEIFIFQKGVTMKNSLLLVPFLNAFSRPNAKPIRQVCQLLARFPEDIFLELGPRGVELHYKRWELKRDIRLGGLKIVLTSLERGLKHEGLFVTQMTHHSEPLKKWQFISYTFPAQARPVPCPHLDPFFNKYLGRPPLEIPM